MTDLHCEIAKLRVELDDLKDTNEHLAVLLMEARKEAAREVFEELEEIINNTGYIDEIDWGSLKKKYCGEGEKRLRS